MDVSPSATSSPLVEYRKLMAALTARAARIGAADPEGAAQEAVKRSLINPLSRPAVEYYFRQPGAPDPSPAWSLLQLVGWLHGVLRFVVLEERARAAREIPTADDRMPEPVDPAQTPLQAVIDSELRGIVRDALSTLSADHRSAVLLRLQGTKYADIATKLGVNENTIATWVRRGSRALVEQVRRRMAAPSESESFDRRDTASATHG
jgi:RNA polymerase sigma factor (sigma-70 family)